MGELRGFIEHDRKTEETIDPNERIKNYKEFAKPLSEKELNTQGARCMDCGIPFCHSGCPLGNLIPDFNDAVYQNEWKKVVCDIDIESLTTSMMAIVNIYICLHA